MAAAAVLNPPDMGNIACVSSSGIDADSDQLPPVQEGVEALMGFNDLQGLQLARSPSEDDSIVGMQSDSHKGLGLVHLFRTASEEAAIVQGGQGKQSKKGAFFGKKKKAAAPFPVAVKPAPKPIFVDDRPRFGLGKLDKLSDAKQIQLASLRLPALLIHAGNLAGQKSVRVATADKVAREAARQLKMLQDLEAELLKAGMAAQPQQPPAAASVVQAAPVVVVNAGFVLPAGAPVAPPLDDSVVFGPKTPAQKAPSSHYWAKGTGFGHHGAAGNFDIDVYLRQQEESLHELRFVMRQIGDRLEARVAEASDVDDLSQSALLPVLESYLTNDSTAEIMEQQAGLYADLFSLLAHALAMDAPNHSRLLPLFEPKVAPLLRKIARMAAAVEAMDAKGAPSTTEHSASASSASASASAASSSSAAASSSSSSSSSSAPVQASVSTMTSYIIELSAIMDLALAQQAEEAKKAIEMASAASVTHASVAIASPVVAASASASAPASASSSSASVDPGQQLKEYVQVLAPLKFGEVSSFPGGHKYWKSSGAAVAPISRAFTRRLAVEYADLAESLPTHLDSSVWLRVHESQMQYAQLMIAGPAGTPYSGGLFLFDVHFPPTYPSVPPQVNLATTGKGTVRFNPNLYACGKVCLSLLGTWSGGQGEGWSAKSSTLLQVAVSIQSLVMVPQPYFNEPSYESSMHTAQGQKDSEDYSRPLLAATVEHAMIDQMRHPPLGFESVVAAHFALRRESIKKQVEQDWAKTNPDRINPLIKSLFELLDQQKVPLAEVDEE